SPRIAGSRTGAACPRRLSYEPPVLAEHGAFAVHTRGFGVVDFDALDYFASGLVDGAAPAGDDGISYLLGGMLVAVAAVWAWLRMRRGGS
ncbi:MAG: lasso RiPP family leader peptide-containing protein, partial [Egibacteraceae bacterium]